MKTLVHAALVRIDSQFQELYSTVAKQDELVRQSLQQIASSLIYVDQRADQLYQVIVNFKKKLDEVIGEVRELKFGRRRTITSRTLRKC